MDTDVPPRLLSVSNALWIPGRILFAFAIIAIGFETIVCAQSEGHFLGPGPAVIPCLPWLPAIPVVAGIFGSIWAICGVGLLVPRGTVPERVLGAVLTLCALIAVLPKYLMDPADIVLRTALFEPTALAGIAFLQSSRGGIPRWLEFLGRFLLSLSLVVFGLNLLLALPEAAAILPVWITSHEIWIEIYGGVFILGGLCVMIGLLQRWVPAALGLMFGGVVLAVRLPAVLGLSSLQGLSKDPNEWSNLLVAIGLWGGMWTLVRRHAREKQVQERPVYAGRITGGPRRHSS
jgi:hypothetical protein